MVVKCSFCLISCKPADLCDCDKDGCKMENLCKECMDNHKHNHEVDDGGFLFRQLKFWEKGKFPKKKGCNMWD